MSGLPADFAADVPRVTLERLCRYHDLLLRWTPRINLIAPSTRDAVWTRHIADSAQLWPHLPSTARSWADLGSGGGLPGLAIAILAAEARPDLAVSMIESDRRKAAFLQHVVTDLGLAARVVAQRVGAAGLPPQDVVSARALAPLGRLLALAEPLRHPQTLMLFLKGRGVHNELTEARRSWHIRHEVVPSRIEEGGAILKIFEVEPR